MPVPVGERPPTREPDVLCNALKRVWVDESQTATQWAYCRSKSGAGTVHKGVGRCKFHDGRNIKHGLNSDTRSMIPIESTVVVTDNYLSLLDMSYQILELQKILRDARDNAEDAKATQVAEALSRVQVRSWSISKDLNAMIPEAKVAKIIERIYYLGKKYLKDDDAIRFGEEMFIICQSELGRLIKVGDHA